jgi:sarcosine oxidase
MGSASAFHLARRGCKVLGIDRFHPPHALGSSHGESRIIREAYFEHPLYVPLVQRAYQLWSELERQSRQQLFLQTSGLMIGPEDSTVVRGAKTSAETHGLSHEILSAEEVTRRFSAIQPKEGMIAICEPRAGVLFPERCIEAHLAAALAHGATFRFNETVTKWENQNGEVEVRTTNGTYRAKQLVISSGSWIRELVSNTPTVVERQALVWFEPKMPALFAPGQCPIYLCEYETGRYFYGFPNLGNGVKVARHHEGANVDPNTASREVNAEEIRSVHEVIEPFLPTLSAKAMNAVACLYTNMPDENFLIDWLPGVPEVLVCSPCSGHGFKFSSVVGEIVSDLLTKHKSNFDLSPFKFR